MKKNSIFSYLKVLTLTLFLGLALVACSDDDNDDNGGGNETYTLTLAHVNDTHAHVESSTQKVKFDGETSTYSQLGGFSRLATKINDLNSKGNFLFLHAGDMFQGTLFFTEYQGMASKELFCDMGLDAMVVGNHEFDLGPQVLADFINNTTYGDFPIVSANLDVSQEPALTEDDIKPYIIVEEGGQKIGIIGITTEETPGISTTGNVIFSNEKTAVENAVTELENEGVNKIIVLSHSGYNVEYDIANTVAGIDVIIGGHSHTFMGDFDDFGLTCENNYPVILNGKSSPVLYVTSWEWAKVLGILEIEFNANGEIQSHNGKALMILSDQQDDYLQKDLEGNKVVVSDSVWTEIQNVVANNENLELIAEDATMAARVAELKEPIAALYEEVVADVTEDLWHQRVPGGEPHPVAGNLEHGSLIAPVVCDGMLWKANDFGYNADIAIQNAGGVRIDIEAGEITVGEVYELMPFGNTMTILDLKGSDIKAVLEEALEGSLGSKGTGAFPYVAGLRYTANRNGLVYERITSIEVGNDVDGWTALDNETTYRVVTNKFIADGGDGYESFTNASYYYDTGNVDAEVFQAYCEHVGSLSANPEIRVTIVDNK